MSSHHSWFIVSHDSLVTSMVVGRHERSEASTISRHGTGMRVDVYTDGDSTYKTYLTVDTANPNGSRVLINDKPIQITNQEVK